LESTNEGFGTNATARGEFRRRRLGGRYDANELFELYPQMAKDFAGVAPARQTAPVETPAPGIPKSPAANPPHP
jgi:hypothetical protein